MKHQMKHHQPLIILFCIAWTLALIGCNGEEGTTDSGATVDLKIADKGVPDLVGSDQGTPDAKPAYADWLENSDAWSCDVKTLAADTLAKGTKILKGITLTKSTPLADIAAAPDSYNGKFIRAEGVISEICDSQGCYVQIRGPKGNWLVLKVDDGTVDFRKLAKVGQYAIGEGTYISIGGHGPMVYIQKHGAMIGSTICKL